MNRKTILIFPLALFCVMFALLAGVILNSNSHKMSAAKSEKHLEETAKLLADRDITIYWAGEFPEELSVLKDKVVPVTPGKMTEDKMPVKTLNINFTEYNQVGEVVFSTAPRKYTEDLFIVIDRTDDLIGSDIEVIRQCLTANNVPAIIVGKKPIVDIRKAMYIITGSFEENDSVFYSFDKSFDEHVIKTDIVEKGGVAYYQALLDLMVKYYEAKDKAAAQATTTETTQATTESTTTEMTTTAATSGTSADPSASSESSSSQTTKETDGMDILRGKTAKDGIG